jgi:hypothetical protein
MVSTDRSNISRYIEKAQVARNAKGTYFCDVRPDLAPTDFAICVFPLVERTPMVGNVSIEDFRNITVEYQYGNQW